MFVELPVWAQEKLVEGLEGGLVGDLFCFFFFWLIFWCWLEIGAIELVFELFDLLFF